MKTRKARDSDIDQIIKMCTSSLKVTYGSFLTEEMMEPWINGSETEKYVTKMLDNIWIAEDEGHIRAVTALKDDMIDLLWIGLQYRSRGIGRELLERAEQIMRENGIKQGRLECFEPNTSSIKFYEKMGWQKKEVCLDKMANINKVLMTKSL